MAMPCLTSKETISLFDAKLASLEEDRRALSSQRNKFLPASRLPVELLSTIFMLHREETVRVRTNSELSWVKVSHVCQYWRNVALAFPSLWARIPSHHPLFVKEMLKRSQNTDITLVTGYTPWYSYIHGGLQNVHFQTFREVFTQHLSHLREISNTASTLCQIQSLLQETSPNSAPRLCVLKLRPRDDGTKFVDLLTLCENVLLDTQSLRHVEVSQTLRWHSRILTGLTHLTISNDSKVERPSQVNFLGALRRMPSLQELHLGGPVLPDPDPSTTTTATTLVNLICLQSLKISDTLTRISNFLHHVQVLPTVKLAMDCEVEASQSDYPKLASHLKQIYSLSQRSTTGQCPALRALTFQFSCSGFVLEGWDSSSAEAGVPGTCCSLPTSEPLLTLKWTLRALRTVQRDLARAMENILNSLPCQRLYVLSLKSYAFWRDLTAPTIINCFGIQPELRSILLNGSGLKPLVTFLTTTTSSTIFFPALRHMTVSEMVFDDEFGVETFKDFLTRRKKHSLGLENLYFSESERPSGDLRCLEDLVSDFRWDPMEYKEQVCPECHGTGTYPY